MEVTSKSPNAIWRNTLGPLKKREWSFDYGDSVVVTEMAPAHLFPGKVASVCRMIKIETELLADRWDSDIGEWVYTIEFISGTAIEIPERFLERCTDDE